MTSRTLAIAVAACLALAAASLLAAHEPGDYPFGYEDLEDASETQIYHIREEVKRLRMERESLKKAPLFFANESR